MNPEIDWFIDEDCLAPQSALLVKDAREHGGKVWGGNFDFRTQPIAFSARINHPDSGRYRYAGGIMADGLMYQRLPLLCDHDHLSPWDAEQCALQRIREHGQLA